MKSSRETRLTINEPWKLNIPQNIMDHYEHTSALTGIPPEQLIAATIVSHFEEVEKRSEVIGETPTKTLKQPK